LSQASAIINQLQFSPAVGSGFYASSASIGSQSEKRGLVARLTGYERWAYFAPEDAIMIAEASYKDGVHPAEVRQYAIAFPSPMY